MGSLNTLFDKIIDNLFDNKLIPGLSITEDVKITTYTRGTFNASTGTATDTSSTKTVKGIVTKWPLKDVNKIEILEEGDVKVVIDRRDTNSPSSLTTDDELEISSKKHKIIAVDPKELTDNDPLCWIVAARPY